MYRILFVCTGNICRSPTAEGVLRHRIETCGLADRIGVDSAGTHGYHVGEAPDARSVTAAKRRGIDITGLRARRLTPADFSDFDLILGLDREHMHHISRMTPKPARAHSALFLEYAGSKVAEVPDPYYGGERDFEYVLDLIEAAAEPLLDKLQPHIR